mgnify:CR=1 FL=1
MRIQITVDNALGHELRANAEELGFSVSAYARHLLKKSLSNKSLNMVDKALLEESEEISLEDFKKQLKELS